jgi:hypothetical protein
VDPLKIAIDILVARILENNTDIDEEFNNYLCPIRNIELKKDEKESIRHLILERVNAEKQLELYEIEDPIVISNPEGHDEWYADWLLNTNISNKYYWDRLEEYLKRNFTKKFSMEKALKNTKSIHNASDKVISRLENPRKASFQTKGLVIGHVQSGKTANFTALIAKAADAGYKLIIVLAGLHNNLRSQTQLRLDQELTGDPAKEINNVGLPVESKQWVKLTGTNDFITNDSVRLETQSQYSRPILLIVKKRPEILNKVIEWITKANETTRRNIPLLMIDDEADLATIDASTDGNPRPTNKAIRDILNLFIKNAYVGYTATPFANMLIDKRTNDDDLGRDLFPRNFIVSLPKPDDYIGAEQIFAKGHDKYYVKHLKDTEIPFYSNERHQNGSLTITQSLKEAFYSFILSAACRYSRGHEPEPMTMLIHTTHLQHGHGAMYGIVENFRKKFTALWKSSDRDLEIILKKLWEANFLPATEELYHDRVISFEDIKEYISPFLKKLKVLKLNSASDDELDYAKNKDIKVIAIGGNTLSRGLTLEGLMTSFFLRNSNTYDTLLQMGRWFGYREGYEDLTRIYTSKKLANYFEDLAHVEQQVREDIAKYEDDRLTPEQISPLIRSHKNLKITSPNKMGAGKLITPTYSRKTAQTTWLPLNNKALLNQNLDMADQFISRLKSKYGSNEVGGSHLLKKVSYKKIIEFLSNFNYDGLPGFDASEIIRYIERLATEYGRKELTEWNVGIPGTLTPYHPEISEVQFGGLPIIPVNRSRTYKYPLKIGSLTSPGDFSIDLRNQDNDPTEGRTKPLLLIYRISKYSRPKQTSPTLCSLFEGYKHSEDVVGIAMAFPRSYNQPDDLFGQPD